MLPPFAQQPVVDKNCGKTLETVMKTGAEGYEKLCETIGGPEHKSVEEALKYLPRYSNGLTMVSEDQVCALLSVTCQMHSWTHVHK